MPNAALRKTLALRPGCLEFGEGEASAEDIHPGAVHGELPEFPGRGLEVEPCPDAGGGKLEP